MFSRKKEEKFDITLNDISVEVTRKRIKNLYIRVNRSSGKVRVSVPYNVSKNEIERFIQSKYDWINKKKIKAESETRKTELYYVSGELIPFSGDNYELEISETEKTSDVDIIDHRILLKVKNESTVEKRKKIIDRWYRSYLNEQIPLYIAKYEPKMGVRVKEFRIKKMKTRWGTCNIRNQRIWLNLELAKKSKKALEMVVVHEMVHLLERLHNKRFYSLMEEFMPEWRTFNDELKSMID